MKLVPEGRFNIRKIAKLFYKYHFFNDDLCGLDETAYDILCGIYSALDIDTKTRLYSEYSIIKSAEEYKTKKGVY